MAQGEKVVNLAKQAPREARHEAVATADGQLDVLLFRLGASLAGGESELFGINVLKIREIVAMPELTSVAGAGKYSMGATHLRGQVMAVYDLAKLADCEPLAQPSLMLITEYSGGTQAFAVQSVEDIVTLVWDSVSPVQAGLVDHGLVTGIARIKTPDGGTQLVQLLDLEAVLERISPEPAGGEVSLGRLEATPRVRPGTMVLVADDSYVARLLLGQTLKALELPFQIVNSGKQAWEKLEALASAASAHGQVVRDKVALMLTDLEMPEMDGLTLTKKIKHDPRFAGLPVVVHSSLSGTTSQEHVRAAGADGYVTKFSAQALARELEQVLARQ
ncbi:MAG: chemotaxis signal transduction protein CheV [Candidimonas sp.]|nr:MAG: chemotaxis signal transduction protein CheV [Candidimonas sp.]